MYSWECSVLNKAQETRLDGQTGADNNQSSMSVFHEFEGTKCEGIRTHRWWGNQEPFHDATEGEADDLRRYDKNPLVGKRPILAIVFPLYRNYVRLQMMRISHISPSFR